MRFWIIRFFLLALLCFSYATNSYGQTTAKVYGKVDVEITKEKKPGRTYAKVETSGKPVEVCSK